MEVSQEEGTRVYLLADSCCYMVTIIFPFKIFNKFPQRKQEEKHNLLGKSGESWENSPVLDGIHMSLCRPTGRDRQEWETTGGWLGVGPGGQPHCTPLAWL